MKLVTILALVALPAVTVMAQDGAPPGIPSDLSELFSAASAASANAGKILSDLNSALPSDFMATPSSMFDRATDGPSAETHSIGDSIGASTPSTTTNKVILGIAVVFSVGVTATVGILV